MKLNLLINAKKSFLFVVVIAATSFTALSADATAGISCQSINGQTTVTYRGKDVWSGKTKGQPRAMANNINGTEYAAAFDGDVVLWENTPGAAKKVATGTAGAGIDQQRFVEEHQKRFEAQRRQAEKQMEEQMKQFKSATRSGGLGGSAFGNGQSKVATASASVKSVNGETVLTYQGREINLGKTTGPVSVQSQNINGVEDVTVSDGTGVIWKNRN